MFLLASGRTFFGCFILFLATIKLYIVSFYRTVSYIHPKETRKEKDDFEQLLSPLVHLPEAEKWDLDFIDGRIHLLTHFLMGLLKFNVLWNQQKCFKLIGAGVQQLYDINNMCYLTSGWCVLNICHLLILCVLELSFHS